MKYVTCVGTRNCSDLEAKIARYIGHELFRRGYGIRSGLADGLDINFYNGFVNNGRELTVDRMEMFMPQKYFKGFHHDGQTYFSVPDMEIYPRCQSIASAIHPNWKACAGWAVWLHSRNIPQVLGSRLDEPSVALITSAKEISPGRCKGGTNTAYHLAYLAVIPILNYYGMTTRKEIDTLLLKLNE